MKHILVQGATSAIAQAFCRARAPSGAHFWLLGRNESRLRIVADDLRARGAARVDVRALESGSYVSLKSAIEEGFQQNGRFDLFLAAQGSLPSQELCESDPQILTDFFQASAVEIMQAALLVAVKFEEQREGVCVILGSVAGDRGRRTNYVYGAAKSALETFCEGLRQRLEPGSRVILVKPGPVDTPMTAHLQKNGLFSSPERVADGIWAAINRRSAVIYTPFYWRWIMTIIRFLPRRLVKRLRA
jgi:decaprenylphospho-beta-D-erythro-pentofuranosid-2-ulose 2-reductase